MYKINATDGTRVLAADHNVIAAWLFGSAQHGEVRTGGDLDIGIFFESKPSLNEQIDLMLALQDAYDLEDIDVIVLNGASAILRFEAVSGKLIFCRDPERRSGFVSLAAREYEHAMAMIQRALAWQRADAQQAQIKQAPITA